MSEKTKRPQRTAEQRIADLKAQAEALEAKVKEKKLASFAKDNERYTSMVAKLDKLYAEVVDLYTKLKTTAEENDIDVYLLLPPLIERPAAEDENTEANA